MTGLRAFHREIAPKNYNYMKPGIERASWNADCMEVIDPLGNRLRFSEDV
jgi:hypothetical protein